MNILASSIIRLDASKKGDIAILNKKDGIMSSIGNLEG